MDSDGERSARAGAPLDGTLTGRITDLLPSGLYRVRLDEGPQIVAHIADRMDRNFIRALVGDRVRVQLSGVDAHRGRIVGKL